MRVFKAITLTSTEDDPLEAGRVKVFIPELAKSETDWELFNFYLSKIAKSVGIKEPDYSKILNDFKSETKKVWEGGKRLIGGAAAAIKGVFVHVDEDEACKMKGIMPPSLWKKLPFPIAYVLCDVETNVISYKWVERGIWVWVISIDENFSHFVLIGSMWKEGEKGEKGKTVKGGGKGSLKIVENWDKGEYQLKSGISTFTFNNDGLFFNQGNFNFNILQNNFQIKDIISNYELSFSSKFFKTITDSILNASKRQYIKIVGNNDLSLFLQYIDYFDDLDTPTIMNIKKIKKFLEKELEERGKEETINEIISKKLYSSHIKSIISKTYKKEYDFNIKVISKLYKKNNKLFSYITSNKFSLDDIDKVIEDLQKCKSLKESNIDIKNLIKNKKYVDIELISGNKLESIKGSKSIKITDDFLCQANKYILNITNSFQLVSTMGNLKFSSKFGDIEFSSLLGDISFNFALPIRKAKFKFTLAPTYSLVKEPALKMILNILEQLIIWAMTHAHGVAGPSTTPPVPPPVAPQVLLTTAKILDNIPPKELGLNLFYTSSIESS